MNTRIAFLFMVVYSFFPTLFSHLGNRPEMIVPMALFSGLGIFGYSGRVRFWEADGEQLQKPYFYVTLTAIIETGIACIILFTALGFWGILIMRLFFCMLQFLAIGKIRKDTIDS